MDVEGYIYKYSNLVFIDFLINWVLLVFENWKEPYSPKESYINSTTSGYEARFGPLNVKFLQASIAPFLCDLTLYKMLWSVT